MKRAALVLTLAATVGVVGTARAGAPTLSVHQARAATRAYLKPDTSIREGRCFRRTRSHVVCWATATDRTTWVDDNGRPVTMTWRGAVDVEQRHHLVCSLDPLAFAWRRC